MWLCVLHDNPPRRGTSKTLLIANNQAVMNQWLKELDKFFQNIPEWYTMTWCGDERWSAANADRFRDAQVGLPPSPLPLLHPSLSLPHTVLSPTFFFNSFFWLIFWTFFR